MKTIMRILTFILTLLAAGCASGAVVIADLSGLNLTTTYDRASELTAFPALGGGGRDLRLEFKADRLVISSESLQTDVRLVGRQADYGFEAVRQYAGELLGDWQKGSTLALLGTNWEPGDVGYVGMFASAKTEPSDLYYGWLELRVNQDLSVTVLRSAYETDPNTMMVVPEPGAGMLAGAMVLLCAPLRRR